MNGPFHYRLHADDQGVVSLQLDLGLENAGKEVLIKIDVLRTDTPEPTNWHEFVELTYGSCGGLNFERHDQGRFEDREEFDG